VNVRRDATRTYGLTRFARGCRGLLGGIITTVSAFTGMLCIVALAIVVVGLGGSASSDSDADTIPWVFVHGWLLLVAATFTGSVAGRRLRRGRRSVVLWLRRFRYGDATRVVTSALDHIGRSWRVVTLDDSLAKAVGASVGLRGLDVVLTYAGLVSRAVVKWAVRIGKVARWVSIVGIVAVVLWTVLEGGLEGLFALLDEVLAHDLPVSTAAGLVLLFVGILALEFAILLVYVGVLLLSIPFVGVSTLLDGVRGGVRTAEKDKLRTIDTLSDAHEAVDQVWMASQRSLAPRLTVLDVDSAVWRETVEEFAHAAEAVVIDVSKPSEHVVWEVEHVQAGSVRQVFVGHHDLVTRLATGGPPDAADAGGVERLRQLLEGETILAYTTGWLGRWRFQRSLYGELEASRTRLPWTRRRVWSLLTGAASLILWLVVLNAFVKLVLVELPSP